MSAQGYYGDQSYQGGQHNNHQNQHQQGQAQEYGSSYPTYPETSQDRANPYGYPESNAPTPYYGNTDSNNQQPAYDTHNQAYGHQNQPHNQYDNQSFNYQQNAPPTYGNNYPPQPYQQPASHEQYANTYDANRGYEQYNQHQSQYSSDTPHAQYRQHDGSYATQPLQNTKLDPNDPAMEGERGLMGALAGGAIGAYGGHQMGHGVIGAVGGAFAGSKLEDHYKDKKKEERKQRRHGDGSEGRRHRKERRGSHSSSSSSSSSDSESGKDKKKGRKHRKERYAIAGIAGGGAYAKSRDGSQRRDVGGFSSTASNITLDRDYDLIALCDDHRGKAKLSSIDLNDCLTNEWGTFRWARGGNAFASAQNVRLTHGGEVLEGELADGRGGWSQSRINLDEKIGNDAGELVFRG